MCNFKLFIAIMFATVMMHVHGASEGIGFRRVSFETSQTSSDASSRPRTTSKEFMERLGKETAARALLPQSQLAEKISEFQRSEHVVGIRRGSKNLQHPKSIARYVAALELTDRLGELRKDLEKCHDNPCPMEFIQPVQDAIQSYRKHGARIDVIISSDSFTAIEKKCQAILSTR